MIPASQQLPGNFSQTLADFPTAFLQWYLYVKYFGTCLTSCGLLIQFFILLMIYQLLYIIFQRLIDGYNSFPSLFKAFVLIFHDFSMIYNEILLIFNFPSITFMLAPHSEEIMCLLFDLFNFCCLQKKKTEQNKFLDGQDNNVLLLASFTPPLKR